MRTTPNIAAPDIQDIQGTEILTLEMKLLTPMLGGGVENGKVDMNWPIRAASIRGHLRWWWRAKYGAACESLEAMKEREDLIWGSASQQGLVSVVVEMTKAPKLLPQFVTQSTTPRELEKLLSVKGIPAYALGPMNSVNNVEVLSFCEGAEWRLVLSWTQPALAVPELLPEVKTTAYCWASFGGLGSRSRRGFGSVWAKLTGEATQLLTVFSDASCSKFASAPKKGFSVLAASSLVFGPECPSAKEAWAESIGLFKLFRKGFLPHERPEFQGPGSHSRWPEPNVFRKLKGFNQLTPPGPSDGYPLPRAALGLPLAFQSVGSEPFGTGEIKGKEEGRTRMGSPILIKVIESGPNKFRACVLIVSQPQIEPEQIAVTFADKKSIDWRIDINDLPKDFPKGKSIAKSFANYLGQVPGWEMKR